MFCTSIFVLIDSIIEFGSLTEAEEALTRLAGVDINNTPVKLEIVPDVSFRLWL